MRVLIVTHQAPPHIGGVENLAEFEARTLAELGHQVVWLTSRPAGFVPKPEVPPEEKTAHAVELERVSGVEMVRLPAWHLLEGMIKVAYPFFGPLLPWRLWKEVGRADVVHAHGFVFSTSVWSLFISWLRGRPALLTDHGGLLKFPKAWATLLLRLAAETLGRVSARSARRLVAYNWTVHLLLQRLAGTKEKSLFLPNPVDHGRFRPPTPEERRQARAALGWTDDRPRVLFVGRLVPHKGMHLLHAAKDKSFDIAYCGPGDPSIIQPLLGPGVEFLPPRPQAEVVALYHAADLLALPSFNEGFPVAIQEALSCGLPVVTSDDPAYVPYHGTRGLHFCPLSAEPLREAILKALKETPQSQLAADPVALRKLFPSKEEWIERLFGGLRIHKPQPALHAAPSSMSVTPATEGGMAKNLALGPPNPTP